MKNFWFFFIEKFNFSYLILGALILLGFFSLISIPKESSPEVKIPIAVVSTFYPGTPAENMERLITVKVEDQLNAGLDDVKKITSTSRESISTVVVEFNPSADLDKSIQETKEEVDKVKPELPDGAEDPVVSEVNFVDQPIIEFSVTSELPLLDFITMTETIEDEMKSIQGVSRVSVSGVREREVQVIVRKESLDSFDLSLGQIVNAIRLSNAALPVGSITQEGIQYSIKFEGDITDPSEIKNIPITSNNGVPVYVRDIAFVSDGVSDASSFSRLSVNGELARQSANFAVFKKTGGDIVDITKKVREKLTELQSDILVNEEVLINYDTGEFVRDDLTTLSVTGLQTVLLVMIVLFLTLGWRDALIAGSAIPMSFLIAFIFLKSSGNTINFVSLFSLILAVGILVDSAIVLTEGIHTNIRSGLNKIEAAKRALEELSLPVIAGTMTTIAVFFPLFFISGVTGEFIASIPFTIIFVLLASLFVALAVVPLLASTFLQAKNDTRTKLQEKRSRITHNIQSWYKNFLDGIVGIKRKEKRFIRTIIFLLIISLALPATGLIKTIFFPGEDSEFLFVDIETKEGSTLLQNDLATREIENVLYNMKEVDSFVTTIGSLSSFTSGTSGNKYSNISVILKEKDRRESSVIASEMRARFKEAAPNLIIKVEELSGGPPTGAPVFITFFGDEFESLDESVLRAKTLLENTEGTRDIETSLDGDAVDFVIEIDREKVARLGLDPTTIAGILRTSVFGSTATTIRSGGEDIDVSVRLSLNSGFIDISNSPQANIDSIRSIQIETMDGPVLLGSLVDISIKKSNTIIQREELKRVATVSSYLEEGYNAREITASVREKIIEAPIDGVVAKFGGETEDVDQSFQEMGLALVYGLILVLAILVLQFNSFRQAFMILSIAPFILIGIFLGLFLTGQAISFPSIMGFIAIAGIAVNNSIILIDVMNRLRKENKNLSPKDVVILGAESRLRPIILTSLTTVIGIAPLTYASALWSPLAWSIIFGLTFTVLLTLVLIPILYHRRMIKDLRKEATWS